MKHFTSCSLLFILPFTIYCQDYYSQYFDGADTSVYGSIFIVWDTSTSNTWQIGPPQKVIFDSAATAPNVMVTDTINPYPPNDTSSFTIRVSNEFPQWWWGIEAIQWKQKLNFDSAFDGGIIEFTLDSGKTWQNVIDNPNVYNVTGFDSINLDTLPDGRYAFMGTDSSWKDIWLCFENSWLISQSDTIRLRFTMVSDSVNNGSEGWMIDNMLAHKTIFHTINEIKQDKYIEISPNPTDGRVNIKIRKTEKYHVIENMKLMNVEGKIMREYGISPTKYFIDIGDLPDGIYFLKIKTNLQTETMRVVLQH